MFKTREADCAGVGRGDGIDRASPVSAETLERLTPPLAGTHDQHAFQDHGQHWVGGSWLSHGLVQFACASK